MAPHSTSHVAPPHTVAVPKVGNLP